MFVTGDVLGAAAPSKTRGKVVTVLEALANADRGLQGKFANEPRVEASVRQALAKVYIELGVYEKAEGHAARAFALRERLLGPEQEDTCSRRCKCAAGSITNSENTTSTSRARRCSAGCWRSAAGRVATRPELTLLAMNGLAAILGRTNKLDEAATLEQRVLEIRRNTKGPEDRQTVMAMHNYAIGLMNAGKLKEAEPLFREVVQSDIKNRPDHPSTLNSMNSYLWILSQLGRFEEAADLSRRSMEAHVRILKIQHPDTQRAILTAIDMTRACGKDEQALQMTDRMLEQARRELGPDYPWTLDLLSARVALLYSLGDLTRAGAAAEALVEARTRKPGREDLQTLFGLRNLAVIRRDQGESAKASAAKLQRRPRRGRAAGPRLGEDKADRPG